VDEVLLVVERDADVRSASEHTAQERARHRPEEGEDPQVLRLA